MTATSSSGVAGQYHPLPAAQIRISKAEDRSNSRTQSLSAPRPSDLSRWLSALSPDYSAAIHKSHGCPRSWGTVTRTVPVLVLPDASLLWTVMV